MSATTTTEAPPDGAAPKKQPSAIVRWWRRSSATMIFFLILFVLLFILLWSRIVYNIPPGSVGVLWLRFFGGTVTEGYYREGIHVIFPWDKLYIYDARLQRLDQQIIALTQDGLPVEIHISLTYAIDPDQVGNLHKAIGPQYAESLITPIVSSQIVLLVAGRRAEALYSLGQREVDTAVMSSMANRIEKQDLNAGPNDNDSTRDTRLLKLGDINIRRIILPLTLQQAIEDKLSAEQAVLRYTYVLERERLESQRKAIEAQGIRAFQETVAPAITESYLKWQGIDATLKLAQSPNSKIVIIGNGPNGLPIILDGSDSGRHAPMQLPGVSGVQGDSAPQSSTGPASLAPPSDSLGPSPLRTRPPTHNPTLLQAPGLMQTPHSAPTPALRQTPGQDFNPPIAPPTPSTIVPATPFAPSTAPAPQTAPAPETAPPPQTAPSPGPAGSPTAALKAKGLTFVPTIFSRSSQ